MAKRFTAKDLEAAMGQSKKDPNKNVGEHNYGRTESLGVLKNGFSNEFNDDGKLEQRYSVKHNEQEAKLVSTISTDSRIKRDAPQIELVEVQCVKCEKFFEVNAALISTEYYRCNECCRPDAKQKRNRRRGF